MIMQKILRIDSNDNLIVALKDLPLENRTRGMTTT